MWKVQSGSSDEAHSTISPCPGFPPAAALGARTPAEQQRDAWHSQEWESSSSPRLSSGWATGTSQRLKTVGKEDKIFSDDAIIFLGKELGRKDSKCDWSWPGQSSQTIIIIFLHNAITTNILPHRKRNEAERRRIAVDVAHKSKTNQQNFEKNNCDQKSHLGQVWNQKFSLEMCFSQVGNFETFPRHQFKRYCFQITSLGENGANWNIQ